MVKIGSPPQEIEMDLSMLASDFYVMTTTSQTGSKYDDYFSQSVGAPTLRLPREASPLTTVLQ